jgi:aconitate hydratase
MYLGIKAVITKSFARIHAANLVNFGILPLLFTDPSDYDHLEQGDELVIANVREALEQGSDITVENITQDRSFIVTYNLSDRFREILIAGGLLNYVKRSDSEEKA